MFPAPKASVGAIITRKNKGALEVLLTKREIEPFQGHWCIPGGYIDEDEPMETAVKREVQEETGLSFEPEYFRSFDDIFPEYDIHNIVNVFVGEGTGRIVRQESEVREIEWFTLEEACALTLAFSHNEVLNAYKAKLEKAMPKDEMILQYEALRSEVLARMNMRQQLMTMTIAGAGVFSVIVTGDIIRPIFLLLYPLLTLCIAIAWSHHDVRIGEIGDYIRQYIEPSFSGLQWEKFMRELYHGNDSISKSMAEYAGLGTFIGTEVAAVILALLFQFLFPRNVIAGDAAYYVLFALFLIADVAAIWFTSTYIRERRKRYSERP